MEHPKELLREYSLITFGIVLPLFFDLLQWYSRNQDILNERGHNISMHMTIQNKKGR